MGIRYSTFAVNVGVSTDRCNAVDGKRYLNGTERRIGGITGHGAAVGIGEVKEHTRGNEAVRSDRAHIEAAQIGLTAGIEAIEWRRDIAADAVNVRSLQAVAEYVTSFGIELEALDGMETAVFDDWADVAYVAPDAGELQ